MDIARAIPLKPVNNPDVGGGTCLRPILFGMRRSCAECGRKKKSCDGEQPCRRCVQSGNQCMYSKRRWHLHQPHQERRQLQRPNGERGHGREVLQESTPPDARATSGMLPMKRFRLSASPATGLVGMQENAFLSDFFGCVGFLPLTTQSHIRETMVKIMTPRASLRQSAVGADCDGGGLFDAIASGADWSKASERNQLLKDPSTCTFWCAIALGALAKGSPIESVSKYSEMAQEAMAKSDSGPADLKVATAWVILAYLYGFMGDLVQFQAYLALSDSFLTSSIEQGSADMLPVGFTEIIKHTQLLADNSSGPWRVKSFSAQEEATPQLNEAATKDELYQYVAQSLRGFVHTVHANTSTQRAMAGEHVCKAASDGRSDTALRSETAPLPREIADAMKAASRRGNVIDFEPLEEAVDRPSVRGGIGSLLIDVTLALTKAAKGDLDAALERIGRCVEIFERYPGLGRSMIGSHLAHTTLVCLATIGGSRPREAYDRLRGPYNSFRPSGSRPVPRLEEWHGVDALCDDFYCRAIDLVTSKMKAFSTPPVDNIDVCVKTKGTDSDKDETTLQGHRETQSDTLSACNIAEKTVGTVPVWPTDDRADCCRMGSTQVSTAPIASPVSSHYPWHRLKTGVHSDRVESKVDSVVIAPKWLSTLPGTSDGGGVLEDTDCDSIGAGNWLDVTHAMLDAL